MQDRDGLKSECILLFSERDKDYMNILLLFRKQMMIIKIKWAKLTKMIQYTKTKKCLEATIVHYFEPNARLRNAVNVVIAFNKIKLMT